MIRPIEVGDAARMAELLNTEGEYLRPFLLARPTGPRTPAGEAERLRRLVAAAEEGLQHSFAILAPDRLVVGEIGLANVIGGALRSANVGFWVARSHQRRGLASAALAEVAALAFGKVGLHRLEAGALPDNLASQKVLERNRFSQIGLARNLLLIDGRWRDHVLFQRTAED